METAIAIFATLVALLIVTRRWFWVAVFFFSGLAALFAMVASVIHFQILAAVGFFVLMVVCWGLLSAVADE